MKRYLISSVFIGLVLLLSACEGFRASIENQSASGTGPIPATETEAPLTQDIAKLSLTTQNAAPIDSKDVYVNAHLSILANGTSSENAFEGDMKIKGRGNFTWTLDKKPYKMKFSSSVGLMQMPPDKEWVLLANHVDKTLVRTALAFEMSRRLGAEYTPRGKFVDLSLNEAKRGSYYLTEQVKIAPMRVNVEPLLITDVTGDALTGGYLVELNARQDEAFNWISTRGAAYSLKEPSPAAAEQSNYISSEFQKIEDVLYSPTFADPVNGYAKYIDVDSFITHYLLNEILKNKDAANFGSVYFFKARNQKLKMGPAWDFDLAAGNSDIASINDPEGWHLRANSVWFKRLFEDPAFEAKVRAKWNAIKADRLDTLSKYIDRTSFEVELSATGNFLVWDILTIPFFPASTVPGTYAGEVRQLKSWLTRRIAWIDRELNPPSP
jgi:hypothetical protein